MNPFPVDSSLMTYRYTAETRAQAGNRCQREAYEACKLQEKQVEFCPESPENLHRRM